MTTKTVPQRTRKHYRGTACTSHHISDYLPAVLRKIGNVYQERPDLVIAAWPEIIGSRLAAMTEAIVFEDGVLTVRVHNSTLYSLLSRDDKPRILKSLRQKFPRTAIRGIHFRLG